MPPASKSFATFTTQTGSLNLEGDMSELSNKRRRRANLFTTDLNSLLYAFGDVANPYPESVSVLEDILQEYVIIMCHEAARVAKAASRQKIKVDDFKFALRNDHKKLGRVEELLIMQKQIAEARRIFDNSEGKSVKQFEKEKEAPEKPAKEKTKEEKKKKREEKKKKQKTAAAAAAAAATDKITPGPAATNSKE